jgi:hypothetical protein
MDMIGLNESELDLCDQLLGDANAYWLKKDALFANKGKQQAVNIICARIRDIFAIVGNSSNFHFLVAAERVMCNADLEHFQRSQQDNPNEATMLAALQEGVDQMEKVNAQLRLRDENVHTYHRYSSGTRALKSDFDREGLPKDGIRKLLSSHKTRLQNESKGMHRLDNEERDLLWYRQRNLLKAEQLYIAIQREALGTDDRSQNRGPQR